MLELKEKVSNVLLLSLADSMSSIQTSICSMWYDLRAYLAFVTEANRLNFYNRQSIENGRHNAEKKGSKHSHRLINMHAAHTKLLRDWASVTQAHTQQFNYKSLCVAALPMSESLWNQRDPKTFSGSLKNVMLSFNKSLFLYYNSCCGPLFGLFLSRSFNFSCAETA